MVAAAHCQSPPITGLCRIAARRTEGISRMKPSRGGAGTVPRPQDGESAAPKRSGFCRFASNPRGFQGGAPPWSQGDSPRKGGRDGGSSRRTVGRGKREAGSPSKPLDAGKFASSGGMSPSPSKAIPTVRNQKIRSIKRRRRASYSTYLWRFMPAGSRTFSL
jgi:hypothetical protein